MRVLVQRSGNASVKVEGKTVGQIDSGLVLLVGFTDGDTIEEVKHLAKKCVNLRIFPDEDDVMNKSLLDFGGDILSISQFTLYGDAKKGNRPSYINAMKNDEAVFTQSIFPEVFKKVAQECYMESMEAFSKLFEDKVFYTTVMDAISREAYKDLRNRK